MSGVKGKLYEHVWCLLCSQRPATGILRRMTRDGKVVPLGENEKTPRVCGDCGGLYHHAEGKPFNGRSTRWRYAPYPLRQKSHPDPH